MRSDCGRRLGRGANAAWATLVLWALLLLAAAQPSGADDVGSFAAAGANQESPQPQPNQGDAWLMPTDQELRKLGSIWKVDNQNGVADFKHPVGMMQHNRIRLGQRFLPPQPPPNEALQSSGFQQAPQQQPQQLQQQPQQQALQTPGQQQQPGLPSQLNSAGNPMAQESNPDPADGVAVATPRAYTQQPAAQGCACHCCGHHSSQGGYSLLLQESESVSGADDEHRPKHESLVESEARVSHRDHALRLALRGTEHEATDALACCPGCCSTAGSFQPNIQAPFSSQMSPMNYQVPVINTAFGQQQEPQQLQQQPQQFPVFNSAPGNMLANPLEQSSPQSALSPAAALPGAGFQRPFGFRYPGAPMVSSSNQNSVQRNKKGIAVRNQNSLNTVITTTIINVVAPRPAPTPFPQYPGLPSSNNFQNSGNSRNCKSFSVQAYSAGFEDGNNAYVKVDGRDVDTAKNGDNQRRGMHVVVLDPSSGNAVDNRVFDTHAKQSEANALRDFVKGIQSDKIVVLAIQDEAMHKWTKSLTSTLKSKLDCDKARSVDYRGSYVCITKVKNGKGDRVKEQGKKRRKGAVNITVTVRGNCN